MNRSHIATAAYRRFAFLEMLAYWQKVVRNKDLQEQFAITRQQAYQDFQDYQRQFPNQLVKLSQGYKFAPEATPYLYHVNLDTYLNWLLTKDFSINTESPSQSGTYALNLPTRQVSAQVIAAFTHAITHKQRVEVGYVSLSHPEWDGRIFHPHTYVKTGLRWHVRGYCEKSQAYRDLVLSRCRGEVEVLDRSDHGIEADSAWQTMIELVIRPDPRLSPEQQAVLSHDYQMQQGQWVIPVRAAMANYLLQDLQINTKVLDGTPEAQQLVLVNRADIKPWLFNG
ncbi:WYL domain-containing protein [Shewanella sp. NIFS-20-20]|uniref:WYL domain-containing protein n=1 Tax=Shewanella sp. NIFS-20-20 TaxID=2853806 RepID=UPI001C466499|nr:WYL domain-containing protein [Shewanella sp. NIFS-20-20]MBV7315796.1 WYL domain-containing protein [Shewanella sp. NIFS-20-20]